VEEAAAEPAAAKEEAGAVPEPAGAAEADGAAVAPCVAVLLQECDRMSKLLSRMRSSMAELDAALRGEISISDARQALLLALTSGRVPDAWAQLAWPSHRPLGSWVDDLLARHAQLRDWAAEGGGLEAGTFPAVMWLGGLFHPRAVLSALLQQAAHRAGLPLDEFRVSAEVTKKASASDVVGNLDGEAVYVSGLHLHGARWDMAGSGLDDASSGGGLKVGRAQSHAMPLLLLHAAHHSSGGKVGAHDPHWRGMDGVLSAPPDPSGRELYVCPVYSTRSRGSDAYLFAIPLRTRAPPAKWIAAGVAILMDVAALAGGDEAEEA
jgi:dynein heavy chain